MALVFYVLYGEAVPAQHTGSKAEGKQQPARTGPETVLLRSVAPLLPAA